MEDDNKRKIQMAPMFIPVDDSQPFKGLKISDGWKMLEKVDSRTTCGMCKKSRKYFCYTCYIPLPGLENYIPKVKVFFVFILFRIHNMLWGAYTYIYS